MHQMFHGLNIRDAVVLDIGSGRGLTSLWLALQGARYVVSMEPELGGSRSGVLHLQRKRIADLELEQIEIVTSDFEQYLPQQLFDLIVSNASINHLDESERDARRDSDTFESFVEIAKQIRSWLRPGGTAVITDACRYSFWTQAMRFGLPRRLCYSRLRTIEWRLHQQPAVWKQIFFAAGFSRCSIDYPVPFRLKKFAPIINSAPASWLLQGEFIMRATH